MSDTAQLVKEKLDIVEFLRGYMKVTPAGKNFKALCPFHKEKTPSFMISPDRQSWHCFGCAKGGDIIKFLMEYENLEFYDALKVLAEKAGVEIRMSAGRDFRSQDSLYKALAAAKDFFINELAASDGTKKYLAERGLKPETIKEFEIGLAPSASDALMRFLIKAGFNVSDLEKAGLVLKTERGTYWDRFRSRIMFPIHNHFGKVIGFTGRVLPGQESANFGKYVNSPETPIFQKSKIVYGLYKTKSDIRQSNSAVLVEGQMDFLMAWQDGVKNIVASSGTALTPDHLSVLRRLAENLVVGFDSDEAGAAAAERAIDLAGSADFNVKMLLLGGYKDPAEVAEKEPGKLKALVDSALPAMQYFFYKHLNSLKGSKIADKKKGIRLVLQKIKFLESAVEKSHWLKELSGITGIDENSLFEEMSNLKSLGGLVSKEEERAEKENISRRDLISQRIIGMVSNHSELAVSLSEHKEYFSPVYKDIFSRVLGGSLGASSGFDELATLASLRASFELENLEEGRKEAEFKELLRQLKLEYFKEKRQKLAEGIRMAEAGGDEKALDKALKEFDSISKEIQNI